MIIRDIDALKRTVKEYQAYDAFAVDTETMSNDPAFPATDPRANRITWISLATYGRSDTIPIDHRRGKLVKEAWVEKRVPEDPAKRRVLKSGELSNAKTEAVKHPAEYAPAPPHIESLTDVLDILAPLFFSGVTKIAHNVKFDMETIGKYYGRLPDGPWGETMIAQHLLNENLINYELKSLAKRVFEYEYPKLGKAGVENFPFQDAALYTLRDARMHWVLWQYCSSVCEARGFGSLLYDVEMPACRALARAETVGMPVDLSKMGALRESLETQTAEVYDEIRHHNGGEHINLNATAQKQEFVYGKLKLKPWRYTKKAKAPSVDAMALEAYDHVPGVAALLKWAELNKLHSTYVEGLTKLLHDGRLHPSFTQHGTVTGRLSCREPNLQNIPRESMVRELFIAPEGYRMIVADYGQIELRVLAFFTGDEGLKAVFREGRDIHRATAAAALGCKPEEVTPAQRVIGKGLAFAISYGAGDDKVAAMIGSTPDEAGKFKAGFFAQFPSVPAWKSEALKEARKHEVPYVRTILGRKRRLDDLMHWKNGLRQRAERQAINHIIQGSAADINKLAIINLDRALDRTGAYEEGWLYFALNVHDEFVCFVQEGYEDQGKDMVREAMLGVDVLGDVPLDIGLSLCDRWSEGK